MHPTFANRWNLDAIEQQYERWRRDPAAVDEQWRVFFEGFELGSSRETGGPGADAACKQAAIIDLIDAYRGLGISSPGSIRSLIRRRGIRFWSCRNSGCRAPI